MDALPAQQKAVLFNTQNNTLSYTDSAAVPTPKAEHIITVHSTAITNGELTWGPFVDWPEFHVPCFDVSGTIVTPVEGSKFKVGDKIYGRVKADRDGAARSYATILPSETAFVPKGLSMQDAASVPMSALTAWQGLFEQGGLSSTPYVNDSGAIIGSEFAKGKRVLILGAAGGVGIFAVQFAKLAGAFVAGTASSKNNEFLTSLGIDEVIDYTKTSVSSWITSSEDNKKFDLVFDCVGGKSMLDGWSGVKENGFYVSIAPGFREPEGGKPPGVLSTWFVMDSRGSELEAIGRFIEKGLVKTWVDSVWNLEKYEEAFKKTASGHARGKVILRVGGNE